MKKNQIYIILLLSALACILLGCSQVQTKSLSPPQNLKIENGILTWDEVGNASSYIVSFQGTDYACKDCQFDLSSLATADELEIEVISVSIDTRFESSSPAKYIYSAPKPLPSTENLRYTLLEDRSGYEVSRGNADLKGTVVIPNYYNGLPVKKISDSAFYTPSFTPNPETGAGCNTVTTKVVLPQYLEEIGLNAFKYCIALSEIALPESVTAIGGGAFAFCTKLEHINIPNSVARIPAGCFQRCSTLSEIDLPDTVTSIGHSAFRYCTNLSDITFPAHLQDIDALAFDDTAWFNNQPDGFIIVNEKFLYRYKSEIPNGGVVSELPPDIEVIVGCAFSETNLVSIVIPNGVKLKNNAFQACSSLTNVSLPSDITAIPEYTFYLCTSLVSIVIPKEVTKIESSAFSDCSSLARIEIQGNITIIDRYAFCDCASLTEIQLPDTLKEIGASAFLRCNSLTEIDIPESITTIGKDAFKGTPITEIVLPSSLREIDRFLFRDKSIKVFYRSSSADWEANVTVDGGSLYEQLYFYVELEADLPQDGGKYWHYAPDGKTPVAWE